jgi:uncharacterized protein YbaA (DUF1428 family)
MAAPYSDLYLLPLPKKNLAAYQKIARSFGKMAREYGALSYREFAADDLRPKGVKSFALAAKPKAGELVIAAVVDFKSRKHRDQVMKKMFKDPRMEKMMQGPELTDMKKMYYGGFKAIVNV